MPSDLCTAMCYATMGNGNGNEIPENVDFPIYVVNKEYGIKKYTNGRVTATTVDAVLEDQLKQTFSHATDRQVLNLLANYNDRQIADMYLNNWAKNYPETTVQAVRRVRRHILSARLTFTAEQIPK